MAKSSATARKASALVAAVIALALALASAALGAPSTIPKTAGAAPITLNAAPGTQNRVSIVYGVLGTNPDGTQRQGHFITDTAGLIVIPAEGQLCGQPAGNTTACGDTTAAAIPPGETGAGEGVQVSLGDQADTLVSDNVGKMEVRGGPGKDTMRGTSREISASAEAPELGADSSLEYFYGDAGNDLLIGNGGDDFLIGGKGRDKLRGGDGADLLDAKDGKKDKQINCGPGKGDKAFVDAVDPKPISC